MGNGIKSFDNEFEEQSRVTAAEGDQKDEEGGGGDDKQTTDENGARFKQQERLIPPLPIQIFADDAEVVLPQALTTSITIHKNGL